MYIISKPPINGLHRSNFTYKCAKIRKADNIWMLLLRLCRSSAAILGPCSKNNAVFWSNISSLKCGLGSTDTVLPRPYCINHSFLKYYSTSELWLMKQLLLDSNIYNINRSSCDSDTRWANCDWCSSSKVELCTIVRSSEFIYRVTACRISMWYITDYSLTAAVLD